MSKIVKVELTNFRNIKSLVLDLKKNPAIIAGDNNLGKSNVLSALSWFFTNTLLTDKWGAGENDIDSIIPVTQVKGEFVSVRITFDSGVTYTKNYKTVWDTKTGKPKGHTTEGYINAEVSKNMTLWTDSLWNEIKFQPHLKAFNELRLFTDPLYALQKLDPKELRKLLVALGCSCTNEEVFEVLEHEGYDLQYVKAKAKKYNDEFTAMRLDIKKMIKASLESLAITENQLAIYNDASEVNEEEIKDLNKTIEALNTEYYNTQDDAIANLLSENARKQEEVKSAKDIFSKSQTADNNIKLEKVAAQIEAYEKEVKDSLTKRTEKQQLELDKLLFQSVALESKYNTYKKSIENLTNNLSVSSQSGKNLIEQQKQAIVELNEVKDSTFNEKVVCPYCHNEFVVDPVKAEAFEAAKVSKISALNNKINTINESLVKHKQTFTELKNQRAESEREMESIGKELEAVQESIASLKAEISQIESTPIDTTKVDQLRLEKATLLKFEPNTEKYDTELEALKKERETLETKSSSAIAEKKSELAMKIQEATSKRDQLNIAKSRYETKKSLLKKLEEITTERNNHEEVLELVNAVIHKSIDMSNKKAYEKTGFEFVMLEETLSETIKEVCYLVVDGVPFANVNTSRKAIIGTTFINKIKDLLNAEYGVEKNDLPVLFDKLESISLKTLESNEQLLTQCQFICTKVTEEKEITIL